MQRSDLEGSPVALAPWLLNKLLVRGERAGFPVNACYVNAETACAKAIRHERRSIVAFRPRQFASQANSVTSVSA